MKTKFNQTSKLVNQPKSNANRSAFKRFKEGERVSYKGVKFVIKRAYEYRGKPFCIISNSVVQSKQVSANSLK